MGAGDGHTSAGCPQAPHVGTRRDRCHMEQTQGLIGVEKVLKPQGWTGLVCRVRKDREEGGSGGLFLGLLPP